MRRALFMLVAVCVAIILLVVATRPDLAPGARDDAKAAANDPIWHIGVEGTTERARWTSYARPSWMPWQPEHRATTIGRHFDIVATNVDLVEVWRERANSVGWTNDRQGPESSAVLKSVQLSKTIRGRTATLTIERNAVTPVVTVMISIPAP